MESAQKELVSVLLDHVRSLGLISNALDVQLAIIQEYIENDGDIDLCCVKSDNGYSGLNFAGVR